MIDFSCFETLREVLLIFGNVMEELAKKEEIKHFSMEIGQFQMDYGKLLYQDGKGERI